MKTLNFEQMENVEGGNFFDGACAVIGLSGAGAGVAALVGTLAITGWGIAVLAVGGAACVAYEFLK